jgi:putative endonuclease
MPEHKGGQGSRFTSRYGVQRLVWHEEHFDIRDAIQREKSLKPWPRQWKIELIEKTNPEWHELFRGTYGAARLESHQLNCSLSSAVASSGVSSNCSTGSCPSSSEVIR